MGLILDSSVLIAGERRGESVDQLLERVRDVHGGQTQIALTAVTIVEVSHGIYRARTSADRERRRLFVEQVCEGMIVHPVSLTIARLAGRIEGEQAAKGNVIAFEDLVIGATAVHLGYGLVTLNVRHFRRIPNLEVVTP